MKGDTITKKHKVCLAFFAFCFELSKFVTIFLEFLPSNCKNDEGTALVVGFLEKKYNDYKLVQQSSNIKKSCVTTQMDGIYDEKDASAISRHKALFSEAG